MSRHNPLKEFLEKVKKQNKDKENDPFNSEEDFSSEAQIDLSIEKETDIDINEESNDELIERDYLQALIEQRDRVVHYRIENIYSDEDKNIYKNKMKIKRDPPVLIVRDNLDNETMFYLTEKLTGELSETLNEVKRAYLGFSGPRDLNRPTDLKGRFKYFFKNNYIKISVGIILLLFFFFIKP